MGAVQPRDRQRTADAAFHRVDQFGGEDHGDAGFEWGQVDVGT